MKTWLMHLFLRKMYVLNRSKNLLHCTGCRHVVNINSARYITTYKKDLLIAKGLARMAKCCESKDID